MTNREKDAIRALPCALCLAVPPFSDGGRCQVHRITRGKDGGLYVPENVIPLCPPCHRGIDGVACITAEHQGRVRAGRRVHELYPELMRENGLKGSKNIRFLLARTMEQKTADGRKGIQTLLALPQEQRRANARKAGLSSAAKLTKAQRRARGHRAFRSVDKVVAGRKGAIANNDRKRRNGLSPAEFEHIRSVGKRDWGPGALAMNANLTPERRTTIARIGAVAASHQRWHVARNRTQANCLLCSARGN